MTHTAETPAEKKRRQGRERYARIRQDPEAYAALLERQRTYKREKYDQRSGKDANLRKMYGITVEDFDSMLSDQDNACACCGIPAGEAAGKYSNLHVDHDHATGEIRGLLCFACNTGIGKLGDTLEGVMRAVDYLT